MTGVPPSEFTPAIKYIYIYIQYFHRNLNFRLRRNPSAKYLSTLFLFICSHPQYTCCTIDLKQLVINQQFIIILNVCLGEIHITSDRHKSSDYFLHVSLTYEYLPFPLLYAVFFFAMHKSY